MYAWTFVPTIDLDYSSVCKMELELGNQVRQGLRWAQIVDQIIAARKVPIKKCQIANCTVPSFLGLNKLFKFLSRQGVEEIDFSYVAGYRIIACTDVIPNLLFKCVSLSSLGLHHGTIYLSPAFEGFKNLKTLTLERIIFQKGSFQRLVCESKLLESLTIDRCKGGQRLDLRSCCLQSLNFTGDELMHVDLNPAIESLRLSITADKGYDFGTGGRTLMAMLEGLVHLESLHLSLNSFKAGSSILNEKANFILPALVRLNLCAKIQDPHVVDLLCRLFDSVPFLQKLIIEMDISAVEDRSGFDNCWVTGRPFAFQLCHLEDVTIKGLWENFHLDFARFFLLYSKVLKQMTIHFPSDISHTRKQSFTKELLEAQKGSPNANLVLKQSQ